MSRYRALQSLLRQPPGGCGSTSGCISSSRFLASGRSVSPHVPSPSTSTNAAAGAHGGQDPAGAREWSPQMQKYLETQAYLFNEKPPAEGESRKWFYWEPSYYLVWAGLIFALVMGYRAPETIQDWARDEAEERIRRRIQGQPVEYGYNYATFRYMREHGKPHPQDPDLSEEERQEARQRIQHRSNQILERQRDRLDETAFAQVQRFLHEKKD